MHQKMLSALIFAPVLALAQTPAGFRGDVLRQVNDVEKKLTALAEAFPAEKFSWRPGAGVRSVSEVFMHVAGGNYLLIGLTGVKPPAGLSPDMEKTVTEKAKVIEFMKQSFEHVRKAVNGATDADLEKPAKFFGRPSTVREIYFVASNHFHEHLGQAIAYARMNGIVPPWSQ